MQFKPNEALPGAQPDLWSMLFKLGQDMGIGIKDLPRMITAIGDAAKEVKELNREMPILDTIKAVQELLQNKEEIASLVEVISRGIHQEKDVGVRSTGDG